MRDAAEQIIRITDDPESTKGKVGRRPLPHSHYVEVAEVYREAFALGLNPTKAVADHWIVSKSQASKWVWRCRNLYGLLPDTVPGVAAGYEEEA